MRFGRRTALVTGGSLLTMAGSTSSAAALRPRISRFCVRPVGCVRSAPPPRDTMQRRPIRIRTKAGSRHFATISSAAKAYRMNPVVILKRLARGWSPEQAVSIAPPPAKPPHVLSKPVLVRDGRVVRRFASITHAAAAYGLDHRKVRTRLIKLKWRPEQALELVPVPAKKLPSNSKPIVVEHNGSRRRYKSIGEAARAFGVTRALVCKRWKVFGWPLKEALGIEPHKRRFVGRSQAVSFTHEGRRYRYKSILEAAKAHGVLHGTVLSRLKPLGWTIQQALELAAPPAHTKECYGYIYLVTHRASGRQYVGQTLLHISKRWEEHVRSSQDADPTGPHLRCAIKKHGSRAFTIKEIDRTISFHDANSKERLWIKNLGTLAPHGCNVNRGGGGINLGRPLTVQGFRYASIAEAARTHDLPPLKVASRLREHKWTVEQALGLEPPPARSGAPIAVDVVIDGKQRTFPSIKAASDALCRDYTIVRSRLQSCGWTIDQALDLSPPPERQPKQGRRIRFTHDGQTFEYSSLKEAAAEHGVDSGIAGVRINKLGWTYAQALGVVPPPKQRPSTSRAIAFSYGGKRYRYESIQDGAKAHGLKGPTVAARIREMGWTYAQALGVSPPPELPRRPDCVIAFTHCRKRYKYNSITHAANEHGLKPGTVTFRLRSGYSIQQALGLALPPVRGRWISQKE
jgi:hypothetical protein